MILKLEIYKNFVGKQVDRMDRDSCMEDTHIGIFLSELSAVLKTLLRAVT